jgi:hypothetical protein
MSYKHSLNQILNPNPMFSPPVSVWYMTALFKNAFLNLIPSYSGISFSQTLQYSCRSESHLDDSVLHYCFRHWQELGYLIIYITGRPDMQQQKVVSWLSQHNFPHGLVSFADGLSTDPLGHKATYLKNLIQVCAICKGLWLSKHKQFWLEK